jgi:hypothetical protein
MAQAKQIEGVTRIVLPDGRWMTNAIIFTPPRWRGFWLLLAAFLLGGMLMP